jgi:hypothetical protein
LSKGPSRYLAIYGLIFILTISWLLSLRPVRLNIGNYLFEQGEFVPAIKWHERVIRKDNFHITQGEDIRVLFNQDLSHFRLLSMRIIDHALFNTTRLMGFKSNNLNLLARNPDALFHSLNELINSKSEFNFPKANNYLSPIKYLYNISELNSELYPLDLEYDYRASLFHLFMGVIDEMESKFLSADSNYEKAANFNNLIFTLIEKRRKLIFISAVDEFFIKSSYINKTGSSNIFLHSETPLIIKGVVPNVDNYLSFENCPVHILVHKFPKPHLQINGEVFGGNRTSCIIPRVVFWGPKEHNRKITFSNYLGESSFKYFVQGKFVINYQFSIPPKTIIVTPRITFHNLLLSDGKKVLINGLKWN